MAEKEWSVKKMPIKYCKQCVRFDRPKEEDSIGYCTQCGEDTNAYAVSCCWFTPRVEAHHEKEKD